jgi:hypothetical protein
MKKKVIIKTPKKLIKEWVGSLIPTYDVFFFCDKTNINEIDKLDDLIVSARPAMLCHTYGRKLTALDRDLLRAETVSQKLSKLKE